MTTTTLIADPARIHATPDHDIELCSREVTELLAMCSSIAADKDEVAEKMMRYCGEVYKHDPLLANAAVNAFVFLGGDICALVRTARKHRHEPTIGGYVSYLKAQLVSDHNPETDRRAWLLIRKATERACMWAGWDTAKTRRELEYVDRSYRRR